MICNSATEYCIAYSVFRESGGSLNFISFTNFSPKYYLFSSGKTIVVQREASIMATCFRHMDIFSCYD